MNDKELIALLKEDPERGMEQIVTQYTGLLCVTADRLLSEPEDVKDCVNETFAEFFRQRENFDPDKGSLKGYLAVIAHRQAIKKYQDNRRFQESVIETPDSEDVFAAFEQREELEAYLQKLDPLDEQIIRMKYYGGMTAKEIADSLGLPYETVKKRHQRSLKKLRKALTIGLIVLSLVAVLTACAYVVLRYFGIVPGYGINTDPSSGVYVLEDTGITVQNEDFDVTITNAWWMNGILTVDMTFVCNNDTRIYEQRTGEHEFACVSVGGLEDAEDVIGIWQNEDQEQEPYRMIYRGNLPEETRDTLTLTLSWDNGASCTMTLNRAETEVSFEKAGYYEMTEDQGGLLAMPRLENGELIVAIYPLSEGDYVIQPMLNIGAWSEYDTDYQDLTVTAEDGTVLVGQRINPSFFSGNGYYEWSFGPAGAGEYTLTVPYVYQSPAEGAAGEATKATILLSPEGGELDVSFPILNGEVRLTHIAVTEHDNSLGSDTDEARAINEIYSHFSWWHLDMEYVSQDPERTIAGVHFSEENAPENYVACEVNGTTISIRKTSLTPRVEVLSDGVTPRVNGLLAGSYDPEAEMTILVDPRNVGYRWNHEFRIDFEVSETES